jgi:hypothetical protein
MLSNWEIVIEQRGGAPTPVAVFDFSRQQAEAAREAISFYQRHRFLGVELSADSALAMYAVGAVRDQLAADAGHTVVRLEAIGLAALAEAVGLYVAERDGDSYQPPEERERLEMLRPLREPLRDLLVELRGAERRQDAPGTCVRFSQ